MQLNAKSFFLNNTKVNNILDENIDYESFVNKTLNDYVFRECFSIINNDGKLDEYKSFFYNFYRYIRKENIILDIYWITKFNRTKKYTVQGNRSTGTISNFLYLNPKAKYSQLQFSKALKYFYILTTHNLLGLVLKNNFYPHIEVSKVEIDEIINNSTLETLLDNLITISEKYLKNK